MAPPEAREALTPQASGVSGKLFPLKLCPCLPAEWAWYIPATVRTVHDITHLVLVIGTLGAGAMLAEGLMAVFLFHSCGRTLRCIRKVLTIIFVVPCIFYFIQMIGRYDGNLQAKQLAAEEKQEELRQNYKETIDEMGGLLARSLESSSTLAERNFESKRRDFMRFLERVRARHLEQFAAAGASMQDFHKEFMQFILCWLLVFQECSIDPINNPRIVATKDELTRCGTLGDLANLLQDRLKAAEVCFISQQRDRDQRMLGTMQVTQQSSRSVVCLFTRNMKSTQLAFIVRAWRAVTVRKLAKKRGVRPEVFSPEVFQEDLEVGEAPKTCACSCTWFRFGPTVPYPVDAKKDPDGFPRLVSTGLFTLVILSRSHLKLLVGFLAAIACFVLDAIEWPPMWKSMLQVSMVEVCLVMLLLRFEELDEVQRLNGMIAALEEESRLAKERHREMCAFWHQAQRITDLWLYRTVPRLELIKELHGYLEDAEPGELEVRMKGMVPALQDLERVIGPLHMWEEGGELAEAEKKAFAKSVVELCHQAEAPDMLRRLRELPELAVVDTRRKTCVLRASLGGTQHCA